MRLKAHPSGDIGPFACKYGGALQPTDMEPRYQHTRELARRLIEKHRIVKAPVQIDRIIHAEGLRIHGKAWGANFGLDALLFHSHRAIFVNTDKSRVRQRFSLAHELGHFLLNHDYYRRLPSDIDLDHPPSDAHSVSDPFEKEANAFARECLVPREMLAVLRARPTAGEESQDGEEQLRQRPFAVLGTLMGKRSLTDSELAAHFDVSREVIVIALRISQLL